MPKFFQKEIAAYNGEKSTFRNVDFNKGDLTNSSAAEQGTVLEIIPVHIKNPPVIQFMAYIETLTDKIDPKYQSAQPFGRTEPYHIWQSATRNITVKWAVPSSSKAKALDNLNNLNWFLSSLYPTYKQSQVATSIAASPLFRVRYANLIASSTQNGQGVLCTITNVSVTHDTKKAGWISINPKNMGSNFANIDGSLIKAAGFDRSVEDGDSILVPKLMSVGCTLNVVHDHAVGWDSATGKWRGGKTAPGYPYGLGLQRDSDEPPAAVTAPAPQSTTPAAAPGSIQERVSSAATQNLNNPSDAGDHIVDQSVGAGGSLGVDN